MTGTNICSSWLYTVTDVLSDLGSPGLVLFRLGVYLKFNIKIWEIKQDLAQVKKQTLRTTTGTDICSSWLYTVTYVLSDLGSPGLVLFRLSVSSSCFKEELFEV